MKMCVTQFRRLGQYQPVLQQKYQLCLCHSVWQCVCVCACARASVGRGTLNMMVHLSKEGNVLLSARVSGAFTVNFPLASPFNSVKHVQA